jgi:outer membrane protein, heavy metal efflux system
MSVFTRLGGGASCAILGLMALVSAGCAGTQERAARDEVARRARDFDEAPRDEPPERRGGPALDHYVAMAAERSPELRAAFERWRAAVHRIAPARRLPDPMVEFGLFVWNSGENAGVTPARAGLRQEIPWPTRPGADADAATAEAMALQRRFEALLLDLKERVAEVYYRLWLVRRTRTIEREQLEILRGLSESALGGLATGASTLADQQQVQLTVARLEDAIVGLDEQERIAEARLRALLAVPPGSSLETLEELPPLALPAESEEALREAASAHPLIESFALRGEAADAVARSQRAGRLPGFSLGVEWMRMPGPMGTSGIMPNVGVRLPIFQRSYAEGVRAAEAEAAAQRADGDAAAHWAHAELEETMAMVRDSLRRAELNERVLLPQAEAAYSSVLGAYRVNRSTVAASLLAQRDLLEIRVSLEQARAEHATAWARLERVVGRPVERSVTARGGRDE